MVVVYYTQTYFLDAAIETILSIKQNVDLHLVIELTPYSTKSTIIEIESLNKLNVIEQFETVIGFDKARYYDHYFKGLASVNFVIFNHEILDFHFLLCHFDDFAHCVYMRM